MDIESHLEAFEKKAIEIGDLKRAVCYNWLRNAVITSQIDQIEVFEKLFQIHADSLIPSYK